MTTLQAHDECNLWLPPRRLRSYICAKIAVSLIVGIIFVGWLWIQWSNPVMRIVAIALLIVTAWVLVGSILDDITRSRGRQLAIDGDDVLVKLPTGETRFRQSHLHHAHWRSDDVESLGLWFFDADNQTLAHLDDGFAGDEAEARALVDWLRKHTQLQLPVQWH